MSFEQNNFFVIRNAISKELANFASDYFLLKRKAATTIKKFGYFHPNEEIMGLVDGDEQVPNAYACYGDIVMETILDKLHPIMEERTNLKLYKNYSYARIYEKGSKLDKHRDRFSCEISTTMALGGDKWPIYIEPDNKVELDFGDMLVYKGKIMEHWREPLQGNVCVQAFFHYTDVETEGANINEYDGREHLGLPSWFKFNAKQD